MTTQTTNKQLYEPAYNQTSPTWDTLLNYNTGVIDNALGSTVSIAASSSNITLTTTQTQYMRILFTGVLTTNITVTFPAVGGQWVITDSTTNSGGSSYTITLASAGGGTSVLTSQGFSVGVYSDTTNMGYTNGGVTSSSGATNGVFYLNNQTVSASYTIPSTSNAMTAGPITISSGVTVTINSPSTWVIL